MASLEPGPSWVDDEEMHLIAEIHPAHAKHV